MRARLLYLSILLLAVVAGVGQAGHTPAFHSGGTASVEPLPLNPLLDPFGFQIGPIPPGFFDPGSDPFGTGTPLLWQPASPNPPMVVDFLDDISLPPPYPSSDVVPIEIVQLSLVSINPIQVTYFGGGSPQLWNVQLGLHLTQPSQGSATLTTDDGLSGEFDAAFNIYPRLTFTRLSDSATRVLEWPNMNPYTMTWPDVEWSTHDCPPQVLGDPDFCLEFTEFGHAIQDNQVPNFADMVVEEACTDADGDGISGCYDPTPDGDVPAGFDLLTTVDPATYEIPPSNPVPPGFFDPGSDPFLGPILYAGDPVDPGTTGLMDTLIERLAPANLPLPYPSTDTVPIEIVQMNLVSLNPITVTYGGGGSPELWDVRLGVSTITPSTGTAAYTAIDADGGTAELELQIVPRFEFERQGDGAVRILDGAMIGLAYNSNAVVADAILWSHSCPPERVDTLDGNNPVTCYIPFQPNYADLVNGISPNVDHTVELACWDDDTDDVSDCRDNCPGLSNPTQADNDGDGAGNACDSTPDGDVPAGVDFLEFVSASEGVNPGPLPAEFFNPGSDPFLGPIGPLRGISLAPASGTADTIIQRLAPANLPGPFPSLAQVPIEIVALNLQSVNPITVTYDGGGSPELWDVRLELGPGPQTPGQMTITKTNSMGGTFDIDLPVELQFRFVRQSDLTQRTIVYDVQITQQGLQWSHTCMPQGVQSPAFCPGSNGTTRSEMSWCVDDCPFDYVVYAHACADPDLDDVANCAVDNCPAEANPGQENQDGDEYGDACEQPNCVTIVNHWTVPAGDTDCDGYADTTVFFPRASEQTIGTMANQKCMGTNGTHDEPLPDAWPPDFNDNRIVNVGDIVSFNFSFGQQTTNPAINFAGTLTPVARWDLNGSGLVNVSDVLQLNPFMFKRCDGT